MPILQRRHLAACQHKRAMYMHSLVLQFPFIFSDDFYDMGSGTKPWVKEWKRRTKTLMSDPEGCYLCHTSGGIRAQRLLPADSQKWDLPTLAEVSWQQQAVPGAVPRAPGRPLHQSSAR